MLKVFISAYKSPLDVSNGFSNSKNTLLGIYLWLYKITTKISKHFLFVLSSQNSEGC